MNEPADESPRRSGIHRAISVAFGIFLLVMATLILFIADDDTLAGSLIAAAVLGLLGVDVIVSVVRDRRSILSRIGPLP